MNLNVIVVVPGLAVAVVDLDHAHAPLHQPPRQQTAAREIAVAIARARGFSGSLRDVENFRRFGLHAEGDLGRLDGGLELRVGAGRSKCIRLSLRNRSSWRRCSSRLQDLLRMCWISFSGSSRCWGCRWPDRPPGRNAEVQSCGPTTGVPGAQHDESG